MSLNEIIRLSLRYTFAFGRGYLSTFLSSLSMLGLVLAIALLIVVLSVMNGFDKEMRERILALVPHITVYSYQPVQDWRELSEQVLGHPQVTSAVPFAQFDALFMHAGNIETSRVIGIDVGRESQAVALLDGVGADTIRQFKQDPRGLVLGAGLARKLGATRGDRLTVVVPSMEREGQLQASRFESVTLRAVLNTGTEMDQSAALVHLQLASDLAGLEGGVTGLRLTTRNIFTVAGTGWELVNELPPGYYVTNWKMTHGNLYAAIQLSRNLVTILLFSIIGVAAFNVVSSLVLVVFDKRGDIAILRTLGATPANIAVIFVFQGGLIGLVGVLLGCTLGVLGSLTVPALVASLERLLHIQFLNTDVYPVSFLPVDILPRDIAAVGAVAFVMCILAALYPALRAANLQPATVLHSE